MKCSFRCGECLHCEFEMARVADTAGNATTTQSLYLGTITATAPSLFTLGISSRLERVFY